MELDEEQIAEMIHEAFRIYCRFIGDEVSPPWPEAPKEMRASTIKGIRLVKSKPPGQMPNPMENHDLWMKDKLLDGWRHGDKRDYEKKTHPCLLPFEFLTPAQRLKDTLFLSICYCLLSPYRESQQRSENMARMANQQGARR